MLTSGPQQKSAPTPPQFLPLSIARMLWKSKLIILIIWVLVSVTGGVVVWTLPAIYKSEALILVDSQKIPDRLVASTVSTELQARLANITQQILSATQLRKIIADFGLYAKQRQKHPEEEIIEIIRKDINITIDRSGRTNSPGAFRVSYQGPNAAIVAEVANRLANLFIEENLRSREVQAEGTAEFLTKQLDEAKRKLDELEANVSAYKVRYNGQLPQQENSIIGALARLQVELQGNQDAVNRAQQSQVMTESALKVIEATQREPVAVLSLAADPGRAPESQHPEAVPPKASDAIQARLKVLSLRYSGEHPEIKRLQADLERALELESRESKITSPAPAAAENRTAPAVGVRARPASRPRQSDSEQRAAMLQAQLELTAKQIGSLSSERRRILRDIGVYQAKLEALPVREQQMASLTRDYEMSKLNYKSLLDKQMSAEMATDMERRQHAERFTLLDPAIVSQVPFKPNRPLLGGLAVALALALGLGAGLGNELRKQCILGEWELPAGTPVIGRLPVIICDAAPQESFLRRCLRPKLLAAALFGTVFLAAGAYIAWVGI